MVGGGGGGGCPAGTAAVAGSDREGSVPGEHLFMLVEIIEQEHAETLGLEILYHWEKENRFPSMLEGDMVDRMGLPKGSKDDLHDGQRSQICSKSLAPSLLDALSSSREPEVKLVWKVLQVMSNKLTRRSIAETTGC